MSDTDLRTVADRYLLRELIGTGGMGRVWRAEDELLARDVAVKEISIPQQVVGDEPSTLRQRVLREARAAAAVNSPGAVQVYDVLEDTDRAYIVMELVEAPTLDDKVRVDGPLTPDQAAAVGRALVDVLSAAHARGVVHRDVKPANVILCPDGRVKLADFGIASVSGDPRLTQSGLVLGSPSFMAPEQAKGEAETPASDLFSLGATLYYAVEGVLPFDRGAPVATLTAVVHDEPPPPVRAGWIAPVIQSLLAKSPADRPDLDTLRDLLTGTATPDPVGQATAALPAFSPRSTRTGGLPQTAAYDTVPGAAPLTRRRSRTPAVLLALALVAALAAGGWYLLRDSRSGASAKGGGSTGTSLLPAPKDPPQDWATYTDPASGYSVRFPQGWQQQVIDSNTREFKQLKPYRYLRVGLLAPFRSAPIASVRHTAERFAADSDHPNYREVRLTETTYDSKPAALWEYTWGADTDLHAVWLLVRDDDRAYVLNYQTTETNWSGMQSELGQLQGGFTPPKNS